MEGVMTEIRNRESLLGIGGKNEDGSAVKEVVNDEGDTVAEIHNRETLLEVGDENADGSQSAEDTLTRVKSLMAEPPTAKSARP
jgi:hypothetical protein